MFVIVNYTANIPVDHQLVTFFHKMGLNVILDNF